MVPWAKLLMSLLNSEISLNNENAFEIKSIELTFQQGKWLLVGDISFSIDDSGLFQVMRCMFWLSGAKG